MFSKQYYFYGKHAEYVNKLTAKHTDGKNSDQYIYIFNRNIDVFLLASIIGITYNRKAEVDKSKNEGGQVANTSIFADMMVSKSDLITYNYQTVMMLHNRTVDSKDVRLDRAFRYYNKEEEFKKQCYDIFNSYILGGVEVLYEKIISNGKTLDDYAVNLYDFLEEFNSRYEAVAENI
ncbi:hypothetical protein [Clostridium paraputrificum]|uniref:hypothetical protein n=1 Tax=Clostridium paraputrificum TaxID=29363 RepID=UPI00189D0CD8|nr:hypothetical protein [Clostridium paraputrificum]MDB2116845.1 hypothetical protein [Clostridium paraputrificum]